MTARLAMVTGAGRGFGTVVCRHLADADVVVGALRRDPTAIDAIAAEVGGVP